MNALVKTICTFVTSSIGRKIIVALTGLCLVLFLAGHLAGNLLIFEEYGLNVVSGDITDITTPDGRETKFYYNDGNQLTAVVSPDGLESLPGSSYSRRLSSPSGNMMNRAGWYRRHRAAGRQYATATMTRTVSYRRRQRMRRAAPGR